MAKKTTIKAPRKKTKRSTPAVKRGGKLPDFDWSDAEEWSGKYFAHQKQRAYDYYRENYKEGDLHPAVYTWMTNNGYSKEAIRALKAVPGWKLPMGVATLAKCLNTGMPDVHEAYNEYWVSLPATSDVTPRPHSETIKLYIDPLIEEGRAIAKQKAKTEKAKANTHQPTIQERIREQSEIVDEKVDEWLDGFARDPKKFDPDGFNFKAHFTEHKVTQAHARKIKAFHEPELQEMRELANAPTPAKMKEIKDVNERDSVAQLKDAYSHLKKADINKLIKALENLVKACDVIIDESKANRKPKAKKSVSAEKQVAKIKYKPKEEKYGIVSVNPTNIVGASELWVFNTKTRKLGKYVAANIDPKGLQREGSGLQVRGTTITGFDEEKSVQKTVKKPEETLKEFKSAGKVKLRKFLDNMTTVETKLNGRLNEDTVLLKVQ